MVLQPPDFSQAKYESYLVQPGKVTCKCLQVFENEKAWMAHAELEHPELFKSVSYSMGTSGAYYTR